MLAFPALRVLAAGFCSFQTEFPPVQSIQDVLQRFHRMKESTTRTLPPLVYDIQTNVNFSRLVPCMEENKVRWHTQFANITEAYPHLAEQILEHRKLNWVAVARAAVKAAAEALAMLELPAILNSGSLLSWYRQCDIAEFTNDVDVIVPIDYLISDEHAFLMEVCWPVRLPEARGRGRGRGQTDR